MERKDIHIILRRYVDGTCTDEERAWVEHGYNQLDAGKESPLSADDLNNDIEAIRQRLHHRTIRKQQPWVHIAAAVLLLTVGGGLIAYMSHSAGKKPAAASVETLIDDVLPGGNRAVLRLADGRLIELSSEQNELVIGANQVAYGDGNIITAHQNRRDQLSAKPQMLLLTTPNGGQYQVTLPDGTKVWLNAASSLRYPTAFVGPSREVELEGEAYFDVAHDTERAFKVLSRGQEIEVLGTEFNVSAYPDENSTYTTLVTGRVRLTASSARKSVMLSPQEQSIMTDGDVFKQHVDVAPFIAWKEGYFHFDNTSLADMMKMMVRWYDIDVVYEKHIPNDRFNGTMPRDVTLQTVLEFLRVSEIKHTLRGNQLVIK
ncbi:FecR family protein [Parapedobacter deserti]|uniref:FecR family protein n=2 Tax=Parapedobacter deserti TaxID=1912957 RepID=A0ABV7JM65_9SPHI